MPDDPTAGNGLWATLVSSFGVGGVAIIAAWERYAALRRSRIRDEAETATDLVRANLDKAQALYLDRLEKRLLALEAEAEVWEKRARRADALAHDLRHEVNNWRTRAGITDAASVPKLEDPLETESE